MLLEFYLENYFGGWRNVPVVKNTGCFSKGPLFNYHQPHSGLEPPVTPAPEGLMPSLFCFLEQESCTWCTNEPEDRHPYT